MPSREAKGTHSLAYLQRHPNLQSPPPVQPFVGGFVGSTLLSNLPVLGSARLIQLGDLDILGDDLGVVLFELYFFSGAILASSEDMVAVISLKCQDRAARSMAWAERFVDVGVEKHYK